MQRMSLFILLLLPLACLPQPAGSQENGNDDGVTPLRRTLEQLDIPIRIEEAFLKIPRSFFLPEQVHSFADADQPIPLAEGTMVPDFSSTAKLLEALSIRSNSRILVYGRAAGFVATVASTLAGEVDVVELSAEQSEAYAAIWEDLGVTNIELLTAEELFTQEEEGAEPPAYDGILIHAQTGLIPPRMVSLLPIGGILAAPLSDSSGNQVLTVVTREPGGFSLTTGPEVYFPPGEALFSE